MRVRGNGREILRVHGILKRHRGQPEEGTGHNGVRATEDGERSAKLEWQNCSLKQIHLQSDGQMLAILPHSEKIILVDGRVLEEITFVSTTTQPVQTRRRTLPLHSSGQHGLSKRGGRSATTRLFYK